VNETVKVEDPRPVEPEWKEGEHHLQRHAPYGMGDDQFDNVFNWGVNDASKISVNDQSEWGGLGLTATDNANLLRYKSERCESYLAEIRVTGLPNASVRTIRLVLNEMLRKSRPKISSEEIVEIVADQVLNTWEGPNKNRERMDIVRETMAVQPHEANAYGDYVVKNDVVTVVAMSIWVRVDFPRTACTLSLSSCGVLKTAVYPDDYNAVNSISAGTLLEPSVVIIRPAIRCNYHMQIEKVTSKDRASQMLALNVLKFHGFEHINEMLKSESKIDNSDVGNVLMEVGGKKLGVVVGTLTGLPTHYSEKTAVFDEMAESLKLVGAHLIGFYDPKYVAARALDMTEKEVLQKGMQGRNKSLQDRLTKAGSTSSSLSFHTTRWYVLCPGRKFQEMLATHKAFKSNSGKSYPMFHDEWSGSRGVMAAVVLVRGTETMTTQQFKEFCAAMESKIAPMLNSDSDFVDEFGIEEGDILGSDFKVFRGAIPGVRNETGMVIKARNSSLAVSLEKYVENAENVDEILGGMNGKIVFKEFKSAVEEFKNSEIAATDEFDWEYVKLEEELVVACGKYGAGSMQHPTLGLIKMKVGTTSYAKVKDLTVVFTKTVGSVNEEELGDIAESAGGNGYVKAGDIKRIVCDGEELRVIDADIKSTRLKLVLRDGSEATRDVVSNAKTLRKVLNTTAYGIAIKNNPTTVAKLASTGRLTERLNNMINNELNAGAEGMRNDEPDAEEAAGELDKTLREHDMEFKHTMDAPDVGNTDARKMNKKLRDQLNKIDDSSDIKREAAAFNSSAERMEMLDKALSKRNIERSKKVQKVADKRFLDAVKYDEPAIATTTASINAIERSRERVKENDTREDDGAGAGGHGNIRKGGGRANNSSFSISPSADD
jgi:hypothetical protein